MIDASKAKETIRIVDDLVVAIKATGGHKYRELVRMPDEELERYVSGSVPTLRGMALRLLAAEDVISRWGKEADYRLTLDDVTRIVDGARKPELPKEPPPLSAQNRAARRRQARLHRGAA